MQLSVLKNLLVSILILTSVQSVLAKDLTHRLGVGIKNNTSQSIPSLAGVYYYDKDFAITGGVGLNTQKNYSTLQAHVGGRMMIYFENNLNFYGGGQVGIINADSPATGQKSGIELMGVFGVEFFFTGLENLAFTAEGGVGLTTLNETTIRTTADDPVKAGIIFYF